MTDRRCWAPAPPDVLSAREWVRMDVEELEDALAADPGIYQRSLAYWAWRPLLIPVTDHEDRP